jgi:GT2 family glycosyltransferase
MPLFSVVIPSFNRIALLKEALESVFAQRFTDFELIVVDDGSSDGTKEYLQALGKRLRVLCQPNQGPGAARNLGAANAQGEYLAFLDSDDIWVPWTLHVYSEVIGEQGAPAFIAGKPLIFSNKQELDNISFTATRAERFADYLTSSDEWRWWGVSSFVVRRDVFMAVGGFINEPVNGEDADLALRLGVVPGFVQVTAPVTFAYREHPLSATKDMKRTLAGVWKKIRAEQAGHYPGGKLRASERRKILTRHTRSLALGCLREGLRREAWDLYISTFAWNVALGRIRYIAAFPFLAIAEQFHRSGAANHH